MRRKTTSCVIVATLFALGSARGGDTKPTTKQVGEGLMCMCGCPETVTLCNHLVCSSRTEMQAQIQKGIDGGKSETTIVQDFVLRYGVKVLATPPSTGFNRAIWILPGVGVAGGLLVLIVLSRRWRTPARDPHAAPPAAVDPKLMAAVEEEIRKVEG